MATEEVGTMSIEQVFPLVLVAMFVGFIAIEALRPARPLPKVAGWRLKGVLAFLVTGAVSAASPLLYIDFIRAHRLAAREWLGTLGGAPVALLFSELVGYWYHRLSDGTPLWRIAHQLHHSADRVHYICSPSFRYLDVALSGFLGALVNSLVLGINGEAVAMAALSAIFVSMFQHATF